MKKLILPVLLLPLLAGGHYAPKPDVIKTGTPATYERPPVLEKISYEATNRLTLSYRMGFNISGHFTGMGRMPSPLPGHYTDGYVLTDISGNAGSQTWNWGYNNASQVNAANNTVDFHNYSNRDLPGSGGDGDDSLSSGFELTYDRQLGIKDEWHHMAYGIEGAINYTPISFNNNGIYAGHLNENTYTYGYTPGTTPPTAPYQGSFQGPGFVINVPPSVSSAAINALMQEHQSFSADLWGGRVGPYVEFPITEKFTLHASGGLALGLINANASWSETVAGVYSRSGGGHNAAMLYGFYVGADALYQINNRWGVDAGVQYQDLGIYNHDFGGESAVLDLRQSIFVKIGLSFNF